MKLIPKEELYLVTELSAAEIQHLLNQNITPATDGVFARLFDNDKFFNGSAVGKRFVIRRNAYSRNSSPPNIVGLIDDSHNDVTYIHLKLSLSWVGQAVRGLFLGLMFFIAIIITIMVVHYDANPNLLIIYVMMFIAYAWSVVLYNYESSNAKIFLKNLLSAREAKKPVSFS